MIKSRNFSKFRTSKRFENYCDNLINNLIISEKLDTKKEIIYISSPMTGVDNYQEKFDSLIRNVQKFYENQNYYIINPSTILDSIPESLYASYIDKMLLTFKLLDICTVMIVNDYGDDWIKSRGVLTELTYCKSNNIDIIGYNNLITLLKLRNEEGDRKNER